MPMRWGTTRRPDIDHPPPTRPRSRGSRWSRTGTAAIAVGLAGSLLVATPGLAIPPTDDVPIGQEPPPPPPPRPTPPAGMPLSGPLEGLFPFAYPIQCPSNGPVAPWQGTVGVTPPPQQRVARIVVIGDSYVSGEGAGDYLNARGVIPPYFVPNPASVFQNIPAGYTLEDYNHDWRHRSRHAPAILAVDELRKANPGVAFDLTFNASSGAESKHFYEAQNDNNRANPAQSAGINSQTNLVVVGIGGNDVGFGPLVQYGIVHNDKAGLQELAAQRTAILNPRPDDVEWADANSSQPSSMVSRYIKMVRAIHAKGPNARIMLVTYPQGLTRGQGAEGLMAWRLMDYEYNVLITLAPKISDAMRRAQQIMVNHGVQVDLLDIRNAFQSHTLGSDDPYVNDFTWRPGAPTTFNAVQETAHPNRMGSQVLSAHYAGMMATELGVTRPPTGARPTGGVTKPCRPGLPPPTPPSSSGGGGGGGGGSGGGGSGPGAPPGGSPDPGVPPRGGDDPDPGEGNGGYPDIDPVNPTNPRDPYIPDGLEGPTPTLPTNPDYGPPPAPPGPAPGAGGPPPMDGPSIIVGPTILN